MSVQRFKIVPLVIFDCRYKLPTGHSHTAATALGKRYTAPEALEAGIVSASCPQDKLISCSTDLLKKVVPPGGIKRTDLANMKNSIYSSVINLKHVEKAKL